MRRRWFVPGLQASALLLVLVYASLIPHVDAADARSDLRAGPESWVNDLMPLSSADWSRDRAAHLLERAGFGGTPEEIDRFAAMTPEAAVDWLVHYQKVEN
ncbi:MAG TPA: hypothetical protein VNN62_23295, partial [Methylomirabilota bacterium]|nr:hypothetical protein [Methylomirabilota bacterium]